MASIQSIDYNPSYPKRDKRILSLSSRGLKLLTGRITTDGDLFGDANLPITLAKLGLKKPPMFFDAFGGPEYDAQGVVSHQLRFQRLTLPYPPYYSYALVLYELKNPTPKTVSQAFTGNGPGAGGYVQISLYEGTGEVPIYIKNELGVMGKFVADLTAYAVDYVDVVTSIGYIRIWHDGNASNYNILKCSEGDNKCHMENAGTMFDFLIIPDNAGNCIPLDTGSAPFPVYLHVAGATLRTINENASYRMDYDGSYFQFGRTPSGTVSGGSITLDGISWRKGPNSGNIDDWAFDFMAIGK